MDAPPGRRTRCERRRGGCGPARPLRSTTLKHIPLAILYEGPDVVAIDKPAGMVVHAGAGVRAGTLVNALLHRFGFASTAAARCDPASCIAGPLYSGVLPGRKERCRASESGRGSSPPPREEIYLALVHGVVKQDQGRLNKPSLATRPPHPHDRPAGACRSAWSEYRVLRRFANFTLLEVRIGTGPYTSDPRPHGQHRPSVAGDRLYALRPRRPPPGRFSAPPLHPV